MKAHTTPQYADGHEGAILRRITVWGRYEVRFEMSQPDPSHWAAIGIVSTLEPEEYASGFVVGSGRTEAEAICDLRSRVMQRHSMPLEVHDTFSVDWTTSGI
jgi:hypothetical protein